MTLSPTAPLLQLHRMQVTHIRGSDLFDDDVILSGRLTIGIGDLTCLVPCSDVATTLTDLATRREVATATVLLRASDRTENTDLLTDLAVLTVSPSGHRTIVATGTAGHDVFDEQLRALASTARDFCTERGERILVDDLSSLALP